MTGGLEAGVTPVDEPLDHVRRPSNGQVILGYGDDECPYSSVAHRALAQLNVLAEALAS
jgi:hypothetical protein